MHNTSSAWLMIIIASAIFAFIIAKLIEIWFSKDSTKHNGYDYNQKLYWTSFAIIFLICVFIIPCYFDQMTCLGHKMHI